LAAEHGITARVLGETGGDRLAIGPSDGAPWIDAAIGDLYARWERAIPRRLAT
jgi:hypothetical protein